MVKTVANNFLHDSKDRKYYADNYICWPPPFFILTITLIELSFFIYYSLSKGQLTTSGPVPVDSIFIYRPDKRDEIWRFFFYMVLHA
ncbi:protein rhomboid-like protein, partial [Dinothrombium tinctorium]